MRTGLGRGLDVLLGQPSTTVAPPAPTGLTEIPLEKVAPNRQQPRTHFPPADLEQLAASIRRYGVLQPIVVSRSSNGYELVAGHRRVLASRLAERTTIPAVIREDVTDRLELALIENIDRADLNAIELARAYKLMMETYGLTQEQVADRIGRGRSTVANTVALLQASQLLQDAVVDGTIGEAHVRWLKSLSASEQINALAVVRKNKLSVRETEALVHRLQHRRRPDGRMARGVDPEVKAMTAELRAALGTKVEIDKKRKGGRITIEFYSNEEFERLYELLTKPAK